MAKPNYSRGAVLLHRLALGSAVTAELTFDIEKAAFGRAASRITAARPVFVTGLARAGTTALLRALDAQDVFGTLTFRDMPFLLAPNSWSRLVGRSRRELGPAERGQRDGILQDLDSPESLEEAFWRVIDGKRYIHDRELRAYMPPPESLHDYVLYVRLILLRYGKTRYLAKNNNNVLRLAGLARAFPDAMLVHPFRDPVQHIGSLLHHHRDAIQTQRTDPFRLEFMTQLGHHEFGLGHRPFALPGAQTCGAAPDRPDYWLCHWINLYRYLLRQPPEVRALQRFADMDAVTSRPALADRLVDGITQTPPRPYPSFRPPIERALPGLSTRLIEEAQQVHGELVALSAV